MEIIALELTALKHWTYKVRGDQYSKMEIIALELTALKPRRRASCTTAQDNGDHSAGAHRTETDGEEARRPASSDGDHSAGAHRTETW